MRFRFRFILAIVFAVAAAIGLSDAHAAIRAGFNSSALGANDDGSTGFTAFGFSANYFGTTYTGAWLNNNGNMTFSGPLGTFTPFGLTGATGIPIIAPFFADVDTRGGVSALMTYGTGTVGGRAAFGQTWDGVGVGYYAGHTDKLNKFQVVLVERSDTGVGNFDIEFNYDQIQWETGDASGGSGGLGGSSARVGYSKGTAAPGTFFELAGSGVNGAFLDTGPLATRLISNSLGASIDRGVLAGQYVFQVRNGVVLNPNVPEPATLTMFGMATIGFVLVARRRKLAD